MRESESRLERTYSPGSPVFPVSTDRRPFRPVFIVVDGATPGSLLPTRETGVPRSSRRTSSTQTREYLSCTSRRARLPTPVTDRGTPSLLAHFLLRIGSE